MTWTNLFAPIAPYQHTVLSTQMGPWDIPANAKNLRLSVDIGDLEMASNASGHVTVQLSNDDGATWVDGPTYNWSWQNVAGRGGVVSRHCESAISIEGYVGGKVKGVSTLDGLYIVGFALEYET